MAQSITQQSVLFKHTGKKPVVARFDQDHASSDGGAILLKAIDQRLGLSAALTNALGDARQPAKVRHDMSTLLQQRVFGIACGYADGNDASRLASDPIFKLIAGRDPIRGDDLASQPTLSRFENAVTARDVMRMASALAECVIARHKRARQRRKTRLITLDFDPTHDAVHGGQQLGLFNRVYDTACYLPLVGCLSFNDEPDQFLVSYLLRSGHAPAKEGLLPILKRLVPRLRAAFPQARLRIRLDAGFTGPELWSFFEAHDLEYVVCVGKNPVLLQHIEPYLVMVRGLAALDTSGDGAAGPIYAETSYQARSWETPRRIVMRAATVAHPGRETKDNPRFLVTNMTQSPQWIYERVYCARGDMENRIKEMKDGLAIDRTSCTRFLANQFRGLLTAAAYVLMQDLRLHARGTSCARAQVSTLRDRLLKSGAWLESSVRRCVLHLPSSLPFAADWKKIARSVGAVVT